MSEPDIVHDMKEELEYHFKNTIVCGLCAPFESGHQLTVLFQQKQIHYLSAVLLCQTNYDVIYVERKSLKYRKKLQLCKSKRWLG
jgi:hypothetical protein